MKFNFKTLGLCFAAASLLAACNEPPEIALYGCEQWLHDQKLDAWKSG